VYNYQKRVVMKLIYEVHTYPGYSKSENAEEAVKKSKRMELRVYEEQRCIELVWTPHYSGMYTLYYIEIGGCRVYVPGINLGVETIDDVLPLVKRLSPEIIEALMPIAAKYLIAGREAVIDGDVIEAVHKVIKKYL
jgi:hypothetical protein